MIYFFLLSSAENIIQAGQPPIWLFVIASFAFSASLALPSSAFRLSLW